MLKQERHVGCSPLVCVNGDALAMNAAGSEPCKHHLIQHCYHGSWICFIPCCKQDKRMNNLKVGLPVFTHNSDIQNPHAGADPEV